MLHSGLQPVRTVLRALALRQLADGQPIRQVAKNVALTPKTDFLAGANLDNPDLLLHSISRSFKFLPAEQQQAFVAHALEKAS